MVKVNNRVVRSLIGSLSSPIGSLRSLKGG